MRRPRYTGDRWKTFNPKKVVEVVPATTDVFAPGSTITGDGQQAIELLRAAIDPCSKKIGKAADFDPSALTSALVLETSSTSDPNIFKVRAVFGSSEGDVDVDVFGTWEVNTTTGKLTPLDAEGKDAAGFCPELAEFPSAFGITVNLSGQGTGGPISLTWAGQISVAESDRLSIDPSGTAVTGEGRGEFAAVAYCITTQNGVEVSRLTAPYSGTFTVAISGSVSDTGDARTFALSLVGTVSAASGDFTAIQAQCPDFPFTPQTAVAESLGRDLAPITVPALPAQTAIAASGLSGTVTLAPFFSQ